mgnify:CR=1 FL=1
MSNSLHLPDRVYKMLDEESEAYHCKIDKGYRELLGMNRDYKKKREEEFKNQRQVGFIIPQHYRYSLRARRVQS